MIAAKKLCRSLVVASMLAVGSGLCEAASEIELPKPRLSGKTSVEKAMAAKATYRSFQDVPMSLRDAGQLLWAANGNIPADAVSGATRKVLASAGGLYPLEVFLVAGKDKVEGLSAGIYRYIPSRHALSLTAPGDKRKLLAHASFNQMWLAAAPATVVIAAVFERTTAKYGTRGFHYVFMEAGASDQNIYLQAEALGLNAGTIGAFNDAQVASVLQLPNSVKPLLLVGVGK